MLSKLYAITERSLIQDSLSADIASAISGGAGMIQLREKNISQEQYIEYAKDALRVCREMGAKLIINDDPEVCRAVGADGVHLGQSDGSPREARKILGENMIIGVTAKTPEQVYAAISGGADYIGTGAVFGTATKTDAMKMDIATLKHLVSLSPIPVYAIGGINADNVMLLKNTGIHGIAVVSGIFSGDIKSNAQMLSEAICRL